MTRVRRLPLLAALIIFATPATAATHSVHPDGSGDFPTIQAAINGSAPGDIIELTDGIFTGPGNRALDFNGKEITVQSAAQSPVHCILDCGDAARAFYLHSGEGRGATIRWLTIRNGRDLPGGAILCQGASPTISGCRLYNNTSEDGNGGAIACYDSDAAIHGNTISNNFGGFSGGGVFCKTTSGQPRTVVITDNFLYGNYADSEGGAIACDTVYPVIRDNRIEDNTTADLGGGLHLEDCFGTIESNLFLRNTANFGGAVHCMDSNMVFDRNTMAGNHGDEAGGGIYFVGSSSQVTNSTLHGNSTDLWGGGIACTAGSYPLISNTIIDRSTGGGEAVYCSGGSAPTLSCCNLFANAGGDWVGCVASQASMNGNFSADPIYCDPGSDDFTLHSTSPCSWPNNPECGYVGAWLIGCGDVSSPGGLPSQAVSDRAPALSCSPNPFRSAVHLRFTIPSAGDRSHVRLRAWDAGGRLVRTLLDARLPAGTHEVEWEGTDRSQRPLRGGVYFLELEVDGERTTARTAAIP